MLHIEMRASALSEPLPLNRWEPTRPGLNGTGIFGFESMYDASGSLVDFYVSEPSLLETKGGLIIRHKAIPVAPFGDNYPLYANARIVLRGPSANKIDPTLRWSAPSSAEVIWISGGNIYNASHHYFAPQLCTQKVLAPGYYGLSVWAAAGVDIYDVDGLAELPDYNAASLHQFHAKVTPLSAYL